MQGAHEYVYELIGGFYYSGSFLILLLCGVGLPIPEEATLIACGMFLHNKDVDFVPITIVCGIAILIGDSIPFWLGRIYGMRALETRFVRRILHPERFARFEQRFREHGNWATFTCRFIAGVRIPGYFVAGTMRMSYGRFLLLDVLGVAISVPTSIWLAKVFFEKIDEVHRVTKNLHLVFAGIAVALLIAMLVRARGRKAASPPPIPPPEPPEAG